MGKLISVLIVDDHSVYREGLIKIVSSISNVTYCDEAGNGKEALEKLATRYFEIIILDISMPIMNGIEAAHIIKKDYPDTKIIMSSVFDKDDWIIELINIGVDACILKATDKDEIIKAIDHISINSKYFSSGIYDIWKNKNGHILGQPSLNGRQKFSPREIEIIKLLCEGYSAKEISDKLFVAYTTINTHRSHIMRKMEVDNIVGLLKYAIRNSIFIP